MSRLGKVLVLLIVLALASVGVYAVARNGKKNEGGLKEVEVIQGTIVEKAVAVGQIQPRQKFQVKSKISGIVRRALVQVGDTVKAGDPLFEIAPDPTPLEVSEVGPAPGQRDHHRARLERRSAALGRRTETRIVRAGPRGIAQGATGSRPHPQRAPERRRTGIDHPRARGRNRAHPLGE